MWNCVEDRVQSGHMFGRILRKLVFTDLYANKEELRRQNPIARGELKVRIFYRKNLLENKFWQLLNFSTNFLTRENDLFQIGCYGSRWAKRRPLKIILKTI